VSALSYDLDLHYLRNRPWSRVLCFAHSRELRLVERPQNNSLNFWLRDWQRVILSMYSKINDHENVT